MDSYGGQHFLFVCSVLKLSQMNVNLCYDSGEISTHFGSGEGDFRPPSSEAVFEEKVHDQKTQGGQEIKEDTQADVHF